MGWFYLFIASLFEICWLYSLKFIEWGKIKQFITSFDFTLSTSLLPLGGYIGFGVCNVVFYSIAMKTIPTATAFAVWTGTAMIGSKLIDILFFKENYSALQLAFLSIILVGIIGLRFFSPEQ